MLPSVALSEFLKESCIDGLCLQILDVHHWYIFGSLYAFTGRHRQCIKPATPTPSLNDSCVHRSDLMSLTTNQH